MKETGCRLDGRCVSSGPVRPTPVRIRAILLLAGGLRARNLASSLGRCVLDLPLSSTLVLHDVWSRRVREFLIETNLDLPDAEVHVLVGPSDPEPRRLCGMGGVTLRVIRGDNDYRGTAGDLRDLCARFEDHDYLLVGNASQCPDEGQIAHLVAHTDPTVGVTLSAGQGGAPTGLMLVRGGSFRRVPSVGYVDLNEQALPGIAAESGARVVRAPGGVSRPIRDLALYLDVLRSWHLRGSLQGASILDPFEERWKPTFSIAEAGATVAPGARLHDSVVLAGSVVEPGAEVIRSALGPGSRVRRGERVLGRLICAGGATPEEPSRVRGSDGR